jgi:tetratricopeptide (TPR) repeat protein
MLRIAGLIVLGMTGGPPLVAWSAWGQEPVEARRQPLFEGLGAYKRAVTTTSPEAQRYFNQGLNLLFAFNHDEAARSFRQAAELDPSCAMAWWGLAVAQGPHINRPIVDPGPARVAAEAIATARGANGASRVERDLVEALALRCVPEPPEDRSGLDRAYAGAMQALREKYADDADIGVLAAEALMNLRPWDLYTQDGQPQPGTEAIVALIEAVLGRSPDHPMANHLYIHAVEASTRPERAAKAADRLRDLQPGLSHNVHMPSHIDVRLGHWKEAEETNRKAIAADQRFLALRSDPGFYGLYIAHNFEMLGYAAMMRGASKTAIDVIDAMSARVPASFAREHAALIDGHMVMPLEVRMRFGRWDEVLDAPEPPEVFPLARTLRHYIRAVANAAQDRLEQAQAEQRLFREARAKVPESSTFGNNKSAALLDVAEHAMNGELSYREGRRDEAFAELREAVRCQDLLRYSEPPDWILPVRHALGAVLLHSGKSSEAEQVYRDDLERLPDNGWSLFGLARALELQGKDVEAKQVRSRWEMVWRDADVKLTSSCFCQPGD